MHAGLSQTLTAISSEYWIPRGRAIIYSILNTCVRSQKFDGHAYKIQTMPQLPSERVTTSPPFIYIGIDFSGHYKSSKGRNIPDGSAIYLNAWPLLQFI